MSELLQVGERGRELTDAEWAQIERDVDMGYLSYDDAWRKWGLMGDYLIRISPRIRNYGLAIALRF